MSEETAYHEAGHAFMAVYLGGRVQSVTIEPDWDDGPERYGDATIEWPRGRFSEAELREREVLVALAGPVAEMIHRGEPLHPGFAAEWAADWRHAWRAAASLMPDERKRLALLEQSTRQLFQLLKRDECWAALAAVVDHLLAHDRLDGDQVEEIVAPWMN